MANLSHPHSTELSPSQCWALLRETDRGRIAMVVAGAPVIFPVNHVVDQGTVVLRTADGTKYRAALGRPVAFEADDFDAATGEAWSVVLSGTAREVSQLHEVVDALSLPLRPVEGGFKPHFLRIEAGELTGRRISTVTGTDAG